MYKLAQPVNNNCYDCFFFLREIQEDEKVEQALTDGKSTVN